MNKNDFLNELRNSLEGEISEMEIRSNIDYYNSYIIEEVNRGKPEEQVLNELGEPRLIAKTIIDTNNFFGYNQEASGSYRSAETRGETERRGQEENGSGKKGFKVHIGGLDLSTWYGKLILIAGILLIIFCIVSIVTSVISFLAPILIPILVIYILYSFVRNNRMR